MPLQCSISFVFLFIYFWIRNRSPSAEPSNQINQIIQLIPQKIGYRIQTISISFTLLSSLRVLGSLSVWLVRVCAFSPWRTYQVCIQIFVGRVRFIVSQKEDVLRVYHFPLNFNVCIISKYFVTRVSLLSPKVSNKFLLLLLQLSLRHLLVFFLMSFFKRKRSNN